jgi:hypothetical protein
MKLDDLMGKVNNTSMLDDILEGADRSAKERQVTIHRERDNMRKDGSAVEDGVFSIVGDYKDQ